MEHVNLIFPQYSQFFFPFDPRKKRNITTTVQKITIFFLLSYFFHSLLTLLLQIQNSNESHVVKLDFNVFFLAHSAVVVAQTNKFLGSDYKQMSCTINISDRYNRTRAMQS